ncbi:MAG: ABC transporter ATP-binding protein [Tepidisphaerales bacterium]
MLSWCENNPESTDVPSKAHTGPLGCENGIIAATGIKSHNLCERINSCGSLRVAGHDLSRDALPAKQALAYIPDDPHPFEALTVWEHLRFVAAAYRLTDWQGAAQRLIEDAELTEKQHAPAQELSRGMRQKLAICCAYLHAPQAILFDEPLTGLDPRGIRTIKQSIRDHSAAGAAIIISSHLLALVEDICTHLLILHKGRQLFCGPVQAAHQAFSDMPADAVRLT